MAEARKITALLPRDALQRAQRLTGKGITATLVEALAALDRQGKRGELRRLRGRIAFELDFGENPSVILVDTSAWIDFFRGREPMAQAVDTVLDSAEAALCGPVVTELRRGLRASQRARVLALLDGCHLLPEPDDLWLAAGDLGALLAHRGISVKTLDLLIATYAITHGTPLLTRDGDFVAIAKARTGLILAESR